MNKDSDSVKSLNELLQGEYMAVESFNNFISKIEDEKLKKSFKNVQDQHRENIKILSNYIQEIGGKPDENLGLKGKMGEMMLNMKLDFNDAGMVLEKAIEGETQGINMAEKVLRGTLDDKSRAIAEQILDNDRRSINELKENTSLKG